MMHIFQEVPALWEHPRFGNRSETKLQGTKVVWKEKKWEWGEYMGFFWISFQKGFVFQSCSMAQPLEALKTPPSRR